MRTESSSRSFRGVGHFIFAILIMWFYGGQVCPLVESLSLKAWFIELLIIFSVFYFIRNGIEDRFVQKVTYAQKTIRQFKFEIIIALLIGITITLSNQMLYQFSPIESGLKMILGTLTLGFFMAVDMALKRERTIYQEMVENDQVMLVDKYFFPMTYKFALVASFTAITVAIIIILVIFKDIAWITQTNFTDINMARWSVLKEILFITSILLIHIFNLIISYAKNLNLAVEKENNTLEQVANGNLDSHVVVSSNDEFGVMAQYTNIMIEKLSKRTLEVHQTRDVTIMALASLAETRDNETGAHILRTQAYVKAVANKLKLHDKFKDYLDETTIELLFKSAPLHDIGKVGVPDNILLKPGRLDFDEFEIMKKHTIYGKEALERASNDLQGNNFLKIAQQIAHSHHEKWDGSGYPLGLSGENIPIPGRLMAIADVYDALISKRVYKSAFSHEKALSIIKKGRGNHFDPDVHDAFFEIENEVIHIAKKFGNETDKP